MAVQGTFNEMFQSTIVFFIHCGVSLLVVSWQHSTDIRLVFHSYTSNCLKNEKQLSKKCPDIHQVTRAVLLRSRVKLLLRFSLCFSHSSKTSSACQYLKIFKLITKDTIFSLELPYCKEKLHKAWMCESKTIPNSSEGLVQIAPTTTKPWPGAISLSELLKYFVYLFCNIWSFICVHASFLIKCKHIKGWKGHALFIFLTNMLKMISRTTISRQKTSIYF